MYGSIIKQEPVPDIPAEISAYNEKGDVDLEKIVSAKEGQTVGFKIKERILVGTIEKVSIKNQSLKIPDLVNTANQRPKWTERKLSTGRDISLSMETCIKV